MPSEASYSHQPTAIGSGVCPRSSTSKAVNDDVRPPASHSSSSQSQADPPSLLTVTPAMKSSLKESNMLGPWAMVSPLILLSAGLVLGALLPYPVTAAIFCLVTVLPAVRQLLRAAGVLPLPYADRILHQRTTAVIEGDFVVFLIGARPNNAFPLLDSQVREVGKAFEGMIAQLETSAPEVGYLGSDPYVGDHPGRSTFLSVQYWRSYEQLHAWAKSPAAQHLSVWKAFNKAGGVAASSYGIWHETYLVRDGEYEVIYGSMPPMGLALATGNIQPASGKRRTSAGRVKGKSALDSHPPEVYGEEAKSQQI